MYVCVYLFVAQQLHSDPTGDQQLNAKHPYWPPHPPVTSQHTPIGHTDVRGRGKRKLEDNMSQFSITENDPYSWSFQVNFVYRISSNKKPPLNKRQSRL